MTDEIEELVDPEFKYDTEGMTPEEYEALEVKRVIPPKTPNVNLYSFLDSIPEQNDLVDTTLFIERWLTKNVPPEQVMHLMYKWEFWARPNQIAPKGLWTYWLLLAGRGFGKTRTGAEWVHQRVESGVAKRIALVAPTAADVRKVMVEGESGLLATAKPWNRPMFEPSKLQVTWPNGAIAQLFSAEEPDRLRGPQCVVGYTLVATEHGEVRIDELEVGSLVYTRKGLCRVSKVWQSHPSRSVIKIVTNTGRELTCTEEHLVFLCGVGYAEAGTIEPGDELCVIAAPNTETVASVEKEKELRPVYDATVEGEHEFFANGVLVHNCDTFWADELAAWKNMQDTWDMLQFGFRLGKHPQGCITTTPKPVPIVKDLVLQHTQQQAAPDTQKTIVLTKGSTYDNKGNLAAPFFKQVVTKYEGTRLGRQELDAEILEDMPGALWARTGLDDNRVPCSEPQITWEKIQELLDYDVEANPKSNWYAAEYALLKARAARIMESVPETLSRIVVAVDPNVSNTEGSDEIGIVVSGKGLSGKGYVLADLSRRGSPNEWASTAILAHDLFTADRIIGEANQGGNMVEHTISSAAKFLRIAKKRSSDHVAITLVHATRGKVTRAEPVSSLYEQNRVSHVGTHSTLEDQMCLFTSDFDRKVMGYSPDRVDALVWSFTHLFHESSDTGLLEYYQQLNAAKNAAKVEVETASQVRMSVPPGVTTVFGKTGKMYTVSGGHVSVDAGDVSVLRGAGLVELPA